ncbi:enoyl-CoA hydratase [Psychrobacillus sp. OK032]|uniref:enoyl-CoA hydratase n=1 Tax=Psychrobacillus sp. OK032 TaxID=1884358 RepID=UPI0008C3FC65|nr:enoyl-CoA hydratase [Psychrobacillus sp. OK032]SER86883.1 Enoyl-CoA hydratase/carnithine racemase [Psychrobacillus sp. OK032]
MGELVRFEVKDGIATVIIDNPPMNVLSRQVTTELGKVFHEIAEDPKIVVVILTGAGSRAFMAGADIKEFPQLLDVEKEELRESHRKSNVVLNFIANLPKPTIACLNGYTFGGGCELALACDIRIAGDKTQLGLPEVKLGLFPGGGGTQRLPRLIGEAKAKELMFLGDPIFADEALKIGLVNQVVPEGKGMEAAQSMAKKIAGYSLEALSRIKISVNDGLDQTLQAGLELEANLFADIFSTEDAREGVQAFIEKRSPIFKHC